MEKFKKSKWKVEWKVEKAQKSKWKVEWSGKILCLVMNHNTANKIPYFRMSHHLHLHPHISLFWPKAYSEKTNWINLIRKWKKKWKNTKNQSGKWSGVATFHLKWKVPLKVEKNFELWSSCSYCYYSYFYLYTHKERCLWKIFKKYSC